MRVGVATVQAPFVWDPVTAQAQELVGALRRAGHEAEIISVPFKDYPPGWIPEQMLACRLLDLDESMGTRIDRLIGLAFPAYLVPHSAKVIWLWRRHRAAYDLWDTPYGGLHGIAEGEEVRRIIKSADARLIAHARALFVPSRSAAERLGRECGLQAVPLLAPPPAAELYGHREDGDFFVLPGLAGGPLRSALVIEAVRRARHPLRLHVLGPPPDRATVQAETGRADGDSAEGNIRWLDVSEDQQRAVFGSCLGVVFPPLGEDDGTVALKAMLAEKPLVTCADSGAVAELVEDGQTGFVRPPSPEALAEAMDRLWENRALAHRQGRAAHDRYRELNLSWDVAVDRLLA
jgi:Glycosyl transferases group 1